VPGRASPVAARHLSSGQVRSAWAGSLRSGDVTRSMVCSVIVSSDTSYERATYCTLATAFRTPAVFSAAHSIVIQSRYNTSAV